MKRFLTAIAFAAALLPSLASADLEGTRRMDRDNRRCAIVGRQADRDGVIDAREQIRFERWECKRSGDTWVSARFYAA